MPYMQTEDPCQFQYIELILFQDILDLCRQFI